MRLTLLALVPLTASLAATSAPVEVLRGCESRG